MQKKGVDENVLKRIRSLGFVGDVVVQNSELQVVVEDTETALPGVMEILRTGAISVNRLSTTRQTLDDVFLKYAEAMHSTRSTDNNAMRGKE